MKLTFELQIGKDVFLAPFEEGSFYISIRGGEGMEVSEEKLEALLKGFFRKEF